MGTCTKQLIQIGDHKQLRPKVTNYKLTVEAGNGYDLNRSLFERLINYGRPHCTLLNQHRMRPEISALIRHQYPGLKDAKGTENRPHLRGFQHDVVFFNHDHLEESHDGLKDKLDQSTTSSKRNAFEAEMVLKCVRHLGLQNYNTDNLVILTPYLVSHNLNVDPSQYSMMEGTNLVYITGSTLTTQGYSKPGQRSRLE